MERILCKVAKDSDLKNCEFMVDEESMPSLTNILSGSFSKAH